MLRALVELLAWFAGLFAGPCARGRHVWDNRFCGMRVRADGTRQLQVNRRCQLCLVSRTEWLD